jgi:hypothetical protein
MVINAIFRFLITPRLVFSSRHSQPSHTHSASTQLSPSFPHTLQFAPSPNSDASSLLSCERDGYRGYDDPEWTPVKAAGPLCKASDLERYGAFESMGRIPSVHHSYTVHVSDNVMIGGR